MLNARTVAIPAGVASLVLTGQALEAAPRRVICSVSGPASGLVIGATIVDGTLSRDGFTVALTAAPPVVGYRLHYWASMPAYWELEAGGYWETESGEKWELE